MSAKYCTCLRCKASKAAVLFERVLYITRINNPDDQMAFEFLLSWPCVLYFSAQLHIYIANK